MDTQQYTACIDRAVACLSRACEQAAQTMDEGAVGMKELRELTVTIKELAALRRSLDTPRSTVAVEVRFDSEADAWSQ